MLNRIWSQIYSIWYLPVFPSRVGSFTLMKIAPFIGLMRFCDSPPHYTEIVHTCVMACDVRMFINRRRGSKVFFKSFSKSSNRFTNILLITVYHVTLIPRYHSTFLINCVFILGDHQGFFDDIASFEMYLFPMFTANVLKVFTETFSVRHNQIVIFFIFLNLLLLFSWCSCVCWFFCF